MYINIWVRQIILYRKMRKTQVKSLPWIINRVSKKLTEFFCNLFLKRGIFQVWFHWKMLLKQLSELHQYDKPECVNKSFAKQTSGIK